VANHLCREWGSRFWISNLMRLLFEWKLDQELAARGAITLLAGVVGPVSIPRGQELC
jgi:hypothetical protein